MLHPCASLHVAKVGAAAELGFPVITFRSVKSVWRVNASGENSPTHRLSKGAQARWD